jgi:hypothetical protein
MEQLSKLGFKLVFMSGDDEGLWYLDEDYCIYFLVCYGFFHFLKLKLQHLFNTDVNNNYSNPFWTTSTAWLSLVHFLYIS